MATLLEVVYGIRNLAYGGMTNMESTISTRQIIYWINVERAKLIKEEFEKNKLMSPVWIQDLGCLKVRCLDKVECCEFECDSDEYIYKTIDKIPTPVGINWSALHSNTLITYVGLATHDSPFEFTAEPIAHWSRFKRYTKLKPRAFYRDGYIYITNIKNPSHLEVINVKGVFMNPEEADTISKCNDVCYEKEFEYPIPSHLLSPLQALVVDKWLRPAISTQTDYINNASDIKSSQPK